MLFLMPAVSLTIIDLFTMLLFIWSRSSAPDLLHSQFILPAAIVVLIIGLALSALFWKLNADQRKKHQGTLVQWGKKLLYFPGIFPAAIFFAIQLVIGSLVGSWFVLHSTTSMAKLYPILFWTFFTSLIMTLWLIFLFIPRFKLVARFTKPSSQVFIGWLVGISLAIYCGEQLRQRIPIFTDQNFILKYQNWINRSTAIIFSLVMINLLVILALLFDFVEHETEHSTKVAEFRLKINQLLNSLEAWMQSHLKLVVQPASLALIITGIFFAVFLLCFKVAYGSDGDDLGIISLLSGYGGIAPTAYTIYTNYIFAYPLMLLYRLHTSINWLMVFLAGTIFLATWALLFSFISSNSFRKTNRFLVIVFMLTITSYLLMHLTYTMEAGMATVVGLFLFLFSGITGEKPKSSLFVTGILLIVLGSLIRLETIILPLVVFLPIWIIHFRRLTNPTFLVTVCITIVLVFAGAIVNDVIYAFNPAWNDFRTYTSARGQIQDTPRLSNILQSNDTTKLASIHWSENDAKIFEIWFFPDQKVFSLEKLQFLIKEFPQNQQSILDTWNSFIAFMERAYIFPYILLMLSSLLLLIMAQPKKMHIVSIILSSIGVMGIFLYLEWNLKLADRVTMPAIAAITMINLLFWCIDHQSSYQFEILQEKKATPGIMKFVTGILIFSSIVAICMQDFSLSSLNTKRENLYSKTISDISTLMTNGNIPQNALLLDTGFPIEWTDPFSLNLPPFHYIFMGWLTNSPTFKESLDQAGIQTLVSALYQRNDIFMFANSEQIPIIEQYILEHENVHVGEKMIYTFIDPTGVYGTEYLCQFIEK